MGFFAARSQRPQSSETVPKFSFRAKKIKPVYPSEILFEEFLKPMNITQNRWRSALVCLRDVSIELCLVNAA